MSSIEYLDRPNSDNPASYHYVIDRDGLIYRHTAPDYTAYHAGDSWWPRPVHYPPGNRKSLNPVSLGISWANRDDGEQLTTQQMESGIWLFRFWMERLDVPPSRVRGHYEISPGRKPDPRPAIDMDEFRRQLAEAA